MSRRSARLCAAVLFAVLAVASVGRADERPIVVELFTSQGCNSCPPADRVLGELAARPDVLALSLHVTYWDRLGWPDTFGLPAATERQHAYARMMGQQRVYTPQMVIDGRVELVGSRRTAVLEVIRLLQERRRPGPSLRLKDGVVTIGRGSEPATVWLATFDRRHDVVIERGENAGRTLTYHNVVRDLRPLGRWRGERAGFPLPAAEGPARNGRAVLLQAEDGRMLGALRVEPGAG